MRLNELVRDDHRPRRGVRRVALLAERDGHAVGRRAVGLADRRPPPDRQLLRPRRPGRHDADVHGLGAGGRRRRAYAGTRVFDDRGARRAWRSMRALTPRAAGADDPGHRAARRGLHRRLPRQLRDARTRASATASSRPPSSGCCSTLLETYVGRIRPGHAGAAAGGGDAPPGGHLVRLDGRHRRGQRLLLPRSTARSCSSSSTTSAGSSFDNDAPSRHHIHTVVRTPNGNDYGADLLRQHHARFDHTRADHQHP